MSKNTEQSFSNNGFHSHKVWIYEN